MDGLSIIIVCHNGAGRLPTTLSHLKMQQSPKVPWELVVIDNASTDQTTKVALSCWENGPAPMRVIAESHLGVRFARERGIAEAKYSLLAFVDDDNWLASNWVRTAYEIMSSDSSLGAVGSIREAECEVQSRPWFDNYHSVYAVLTESEFDQMEQPPPYLPTAGLCLRKAAWEGLVHDGFHFLLSGTVGGKLRGGEDTELTLALHLAGWRLRIDRRLCLRHFMPSERLRWQYLRKLKRNYGESHVPLDAYSQHSLSLQQGARRWLSDSWWYQFGKSLTKIANHPTAVFAALGADGEGRSDLIEVEEQFGRAIGLLHLRGRYRTFRREIREAQWRRVSLQPDHSWNGRTAARSGS